MAVIEWAPKQSLSPLSRWDITGSWEVEGSSCKRILKLSLKVCKPLGCGISRKNLLKKPNSTDKKEREGQLWKFHLSVMPASKLCVVVFFKWWSLSSVEDTQIPWIYQFELLPNRNVILCNQVLSLFSILDTPVSSSSLSFNASSQTSQFSAS